MNVKHFLQRYTTLCRSWSQERLGLSLFLSACFAGSHLFRPLSEESPVGLRVSTGFEIAVPTESGYRGGAAVTLDRGRILLGYGKPQDLRGTSLGTVRIYGVTSTDGGRTWGDEQLIEHNGTCQAGRPSFLKTQDGTLWMFYYGFVRLGETAAASRSDLWVVRSRDGGKTWTDRQQIFKGFTGATNGAIETTSNRILVPFSYMVDPLRLVSACVVSGDGGKSWKVGSAIDLGELGGYGDHAGALEPTIVELKDGRIWMIIRTRTGGFYQAFSRDHGISWNQPTRTPFLSPNAPGFVTRLQSGRLAFVWNLIDETEASIWKRGEQPTTNQRHRLAIALSEDDGRVWTLPVIAAQAKEISYPFLLEIAPGQLMLSSGRLRKPDLEMDTVVLLTSETTLLKLAKEMAGQKAQ